MKQRQIKGVDRVVFGAIKSRASGRLIRTTISMVILILTCLSSHASDWVGKCDAIPVKVPSFNCVDDGVLVEKTVDANGHCSKPEVLYNRCVYQSRLGRLAADNKKGVDIIFSCRKDLSGDHKGDKGRDFYDIAVIQYDRNNGNTCFYQYLGSGDDAGDNIPSPETPEGEKFWDSSVTFCTSCHANGPFIRTPHYWQVTDPTTGKKVLPSESDIDDDKYHVLHDHYEVYDVERSTPSTTGLYKDEPKGDQCTMCHNIGAVSSGGNLKIGKINNIATGTNKSFSGSDAPTPKGNGDGYHDFMAHNATPGKDKQGKKITVNAVSKRARAVAELKALEECLANGPDVAPPCGCTLTKRSQGKVLDGQCQTDQ